MVVRFNGVETSPGGTYWIAWAAIQTEFPHTFLCPASQLLLETCGALELSSLGWTPAEDFRFDWKARMVPAE